MLSSTAKPFKLLVMMTLSYASRLSNVAVLGAFALALTGLSTGCAGKQKKNTGSAGAGSEVDWGLGSLDRSRCSEKGKRVITADVNRDNQPDIWKLYEVVKQDGEEVQILACKQSDLNQDGKVDVVDHYDSNGEVKMSEFDFDFDGHFDQTRFFVDGILVRDEKDMDFDNRPDYISYYEGGTVARIERDSNSDGKVDEWQYYEGGTLDRVGYDTNGSGKPDQWDRGPDKTAEEGDGSSSTEPVL